MKNAPPFTLPDENGNLVSLESFLGHGPVVLLFYRGDWCAYCNGQLANYVARLDELERLKVSVIAISVDDGPDSALFKTKLAFPFPILSDPTHQVIDQFVGIETSLRQGKVVGKPATYILRPDGTIAFEHVGEDYADRPLIAEVMSQLETIAHG